MNDRCRTSMTISRRQLLGCVAAASGALMASGILSGCGSPSGSPSSAAKSSSGGKVPRNLHSVLSRPPATMTMLYAGVQADSAAVQSVLPLLKSELGIDLIVDNLPYNTLQTKTFDELSTSNPGHDIYICDTPWTPTLTHVLEPLNQYLADPALNKGITIDVADFIPKVFYDTDVYKVNAPSEHYPHKTATVNVDDIDSQGFSILGLPIQANALTMMYRQDLFDSSKERAGFAAKYGRPLTVPETWDEFQTVAEWFTRPSQRLWGTTLMAGVGDWDVDDFKTLLGSFGGNGHMINADQVIVFDDPIGVDALTYYSDLIQKYRVTPPGTTSASWDTTSSLFAAGTTAMTMNYSPQTLNSGIPGRVGNAMVPKKVRYAPHYGTWQLSVPKAAPQDRKIWAYRVIAWLTSSPIQIKMLANEIHPTRMSVFEYAKKDKSLTDKFGNFYPVLGDSLAVGVGRPRVKEYDEVERPIEVGVNSAASGNLSPSAALQKAATGVKDILDTLGYHAVIQK